jgi:hypothetical protein
MVLHCAHSDPSLVLGNTRSDRHDHATGFMSRNDRTAPGGEPQGRSASRRAVKLEVAPAHSGGLDLQYDLAWTGHRVGKLEDLNLAIPSKDDTFHFSHLLLVRQRALWWLAALAVC